MTFQKLQITEDKKILLDGFEIKNVKGFEITSPAEGPAELVMKIDVIVGQVGIELKQ